MQGKAGAMAGRGDSLRLTGRSLASECSLKVDETLGRIDTYAISLRQVRTAAALGGVRPVKPTQSAPAEVRKT